MSKPFGFIYEDLSPLFQNVLKFVLIQDPVKIATGFILGASINKLFQVFLESLVKPLLVIIVLYLSKSGFRYTLAGQTFDVGSLIIEIVLFITFMIIFYYLFVGPIESLKEEYNIEQKTIDCPYCMTLINPSATRCPACTSQLVN